MSDASEAAPLPQHMQALEKANRVRIEMAAAKGRIRSGEIESGDLFDHEDLGNLTLLEILTSQKRWGATRARRFLNDVLFSNGRRSLEAVKLSELTTRERRVLREKINTLKTNKGAG